MGPRIPLNTKVSRNERPRGGPFELPTSFYRPLSPSLHRAGDAQSTIFVFPAVNLRFDRSKRALPKIFQKRPFLFPSHKPVSRPPSRRLLRPLPSPSMDNAQMLSCSLWASVLYLAIGIHPAYSEGKPTTFTCSTHVQYEGTSPLLSSLLQPVVMQMFRHGVRLHH